MTEKSILNRPRLPVIYEMFGDSKVKNPFHERFGKFDNGYEEFVDICYDNLTFAVFSIMKWKDGPLMLAPFQSVILQVLWDKTFPILLMTRGGGKTFMLGVYSLLRAIMVPGSKIVIVAASFRQSKLVFDYIEQIYNYSPIIQAAVTKIARPNDAREMIIGTSTIRALPLGNGEKIRGVRACVSAATLVDTKYGLIEAKDIVENDKDFPIFNGTNFETPTHYCRTDVTSVHKVETTYGFTIEFSDIHRVWTDDGWKDIDSVTTNDRVVIYSSKEFPSNEVVPPAFEKYNEARHDYILPTSVNSDVAKILGYLVSEGCITNKNGTIQFTNTEMELINDYCDVFERTFGVRPPVYKKNGFVDKRGWNCKPCYEAKICRKGVRKYLYLCGLDYVTAADKVVPQSILCSPKKVAVSFLRALFEGDGSAVLYKNSKRKTDEFYIAYYSASRKLCSQLQILLLKFGLVGSLSERSKGNVQFYLRFSKGYATAFARDINFLSKRKMAICEEASRMFAPKYYNGKSVKIKKIDRDIRKDILYDVCMPDTHQFVANGILNHNTDIVCDEYASIPEEVFQVVVRGFAAVAADPIEQARQIHLENQLIKQGKMRKEDRKKLSSNKIIYSGTANYQFNHYYRLYSIHKAIIENKFIGNAEEINESFKSDDEDGYQLEGNLDYRDYAIIQVPYTGLPEGFMDDKQIVQAKATMPRALFSMEYECLFPTDSDGFFKRTQIDDTTPGRNDERKQFSVELVGDPGFEYVMGVDPARKTDNFSISILKLLKNGQGYKNVYCYSMNNKNWVTSVRKIRELLGKFNIVRMCVDSGGGGTAVEDLLQNAEVLNKGEKPIWRFNDDEHLRFDGLHILEMVNFTPSWIGQANYGLAADIEHKRILFPYRGSNTDIDIIEEPDGLKNTKIFEPWDEIEEQINELCKIVMTFTKTGIQHFDLPSIPTAQQTKISMVQRKDRYSALLLSSYAAKTYITQGQMSFEPFSGGWADQI